MQIRNILRGISEPVGESGERTNVYPLNQDEVTTRPARPVLDPPPSNEELAAFVAEHTQPGRPQRQEAHALLPADIAQEIAVAREIFVELYQFEPEARERILSHVDTMILLYADDEETPPTVQGAPV